MIIRDNYVECVSPRGEMSDYYPLFYYNPSYPDYLFCDISVSYISFKRTKDINLVTSTPYALLFNSNNTHKEDINNTLWTKNIYYTVIPARIRRSGARTAVCECLRAKN